MAFENWLGVFTYLTVLRTHILWQYTGWSNKANAFTENNSTDNTTYVHPVYFHTMKTKSIVKPSVSRVGCKLDLQAMQVLKEKSGLTNDTQKTDKNVMVYEKKLAKLMISCFDECC